MLLKETKREEMTKSPTIKLGVAGRRPESGNNAKNNSLGRYPNSSTNSPVRRDTNLSSIQDNFYDDKKTGDLRHRDDLNMSPNRKTFSYQNNGNAVVSPYLQKTNLDFVGFCKVVRISFCL